MERVHFHIQYKVSQNVTQSGMYNYDIYLNMYVCVCV